MGYISLIIIIQDSETWTEQCIEVQSSIQSLDFCGYHDFNMYRPLVRIIYLGVIQHLTEDGSFLIQFMDTLLILV